MWREFIALLSIAGAARLQNSWGEFNVYMAILGVHMNLLLTEHTLKHAPQEVDLLRGRKTHYMYVYLIIFKYI